MSKAVNEKMEQYDYAINDDYVVEEIESMFSALIGSLIINFNSLENELNISIANIIDNRSHELGYQVIEGLVMQNKINLFYKLYLGLISALDLKRKPELLELRKTLTELNIFRNLVVHGNWALYDKKGFIRSKFMTDTAGNGDIHFKLTKITKTDLKANIRAMRKAESKIADLYDNLMQE